VGKQGGAACAPPFSRFALPTGGEREPRNQLVTPPEWLKMQGAEDQPQGLLRARRFPLTCPAVGSLAQKPDNPLGSTSPATRVPLSPGLLLPWAVRGRSIIRRLE
jgi:hypothetical protein